MPGVVGGKIASMQEDADMALSAEAFSRLMDVCHTRMPAETVIIHPGNVLLIPQAERVAP